ncbi:methyltransferase [Bailinhaonella thermotolerans]|uniref:Hydroxyneurosporene methyltransferase n=1 Tax=Bailinhaonella thermotolerans TaxID=1070861 RepID=A0A3A4AUB7_9ACTN|nr:methyltransferase [Bailinhaonella thermotolerans]RJL25028.1 hydroxyneurosporene methyltransferase [Bailinhaonella thermotolerans]
MAHASDPVWEIIRANWRFSALSAAVRLGVAEHLADGPLSPGELAARCGAHAPSLARVLRALAPHGLFASDAEGRYALTEAGRTLLPDHPRSMRGSVLINSDPDLSYSMRELTETVRTGRSAFAERYGPLYDYLGTRADLSRLFDDYMKHRSLPYALSLPEVYDFSGITTVVDVGGGKGHVLAELLRRHPHLRGTLFDLPRVLPNARENLAELGDRCELAEGDFFVSVPEGADCYVLGSVVHNWDDEDALRILSTVRRAVPDHGRVLLLDILLDEGDEPHLGKDMDLRMMGYFQGGCERTRSEYFALLEKSGLQPVSDADLDGITSVIDARPR